MTMRLRRGETPEWIDQLRERAGAGDVEAMLRIAEVARRSPDTVAEAERWLREASASGSLKGTHRLGVLLALRGDHAEGEALMIASAERGNVEAMYDLFHYYQSRGLPEKAQAVWDSIPHGQ